jgi:N-acetyl-gamma-glutamyl-phosphate reductase
MTAPDHAVPSSITPGEPARVAIVGGTGYTGALLAELISRHARAELVAISSEQSAGVPVAEYNPRLRGPLTFCREAEIVGDLDVVFVCTPHGEAARVTKRLLDDGVRVIDLSADHRLDAVTYAEWYGEHPFPELLPGVYGLTELHRDEVRSARLVANPGCYPTAALLALAPLAPLGLLDVIVDAKSGVSGAGKAPNPRTHFCSIDSDLMAYSVKAHRHFPEIARGVGSGTALTFVPHLVPLQRGITETIYVRAGETPDPKALRALYDEAYADERFVEVCDGVPELKDVTGTNYCRIFPTVDERTGRVLVFSVIDNLMKGASGQAVQNMNAMLGFPEEEGLL